ncbi:MAG: NAD(P)H-hydrate dehydratase, partial [Xanthomonadales bacterium]|nr:NAD(P)H-hydrate dehydratase [Xanthomonadales bacterium]
NASGVPVLSLDVPSGLSADHGQPLGPCIRATATASFVAWKRGLFTAQAGDYCGALSLHDLALPQAAYAAQQADAHLLRIQPLPPRHLDSNKGNYGHVLAIGGDLGMAGAIRLCAEASLRCGAGLVSVATRAVHISAINAARPELMAHAVEDGAALKPLLERASVLALGSGMGQGDWGQFVWRAALETGKPMVLDADGLNLLSTQPRSLPQHTVLTPHPGEAARLLDTDVTAVQADRYAAVRSLAAKFQCVAVLKGSGSLMANPAGEVAVCPWGNPGMASGGMGDVLTGVIAGLLAQGLTPWQAACLGVGLHARAGDVAAQAGQRGLLASDLLLPLRYLLNGNQAHV